MLAKHNIISTSVSETVEKIPTDEKDYRKCFFTCFTAYKEADQHIANIEIPSCLPTRMHPV